MIRLLGMHELLTPGSIEDLIRVQLSRVLCRSAGIASMYTVIKIESNILIC